MKKVDVVIIGASASGLMCAIEAGKRGRKVIVLDHANKAGKKILMSGGGRCNFTNYHVGPENYISHNAHFCKSALSRYSQWDFLSLVERHGIPFHERQHGQLFCNNSAKDILAMLLAECQQVGVTIHLKTKMTSVNLVSERQFKMSSSLGELACSSLVVASGGLSIPSMGASPFGYQLAKQFGIKVWPTSAGLVPFTLQPIDKLRLAELPGIAVDSTVSNQRHQFRENILLTHRGLSGPVILQISSYWQPGEAITINWLPELELFDELKALQQQQPQLKLKTVLTKHLPKRLVEKLLDKHDIDIPLQGFSHRQFHQMADQLQHWLIKPNGTEGYRTAEVTLGGVDCDAISSKTMESHGVKGLYFIGEVLDVTGWLGGYNFQWAWSSAWCAGQCV